MLPEKPQPYLDITDEITDVQATDLSVNNAERRVIRQVVEALLFEQIIEFNTLARELSGYAASGHEAVYDSQFSFVLSGQEFRALGTIRAFNRVRLAAGSIQVNSAMDSIWRETTLGQVVHALDASNASKSRLNQELEQTIDLCHWNNRHLKHHLQPRRDLNFQALESAIVEGHLYHPCFKTRTGFSHEDHHLYGPEAGNLFQLLWLAVKHERIESTLPLAEEDFWREEIGQAGYETLTRRLTEQDGNWQRYGLLAIHPWQYQSIMPMGLGQALESREILALGAAGDFYQASQSLRTLVNMSNPKKANVKIPLNVICTSSHRNLQQHFVHTAPVISNWLQSIVASDTYLQTQDNVILLSEYAGLLYEPEKNDALQGHLGVIFRESVMNKLHAKQSALPFSALMLVETDGLPFIAPWLEQYGVQAWVEKLLATMLIPIWHMLAHHGIAFEAHPQNLILIHRNGWPEKIVLRDFHEDTEFVADFLQDSTILPKLEAVDPYFKDIKLDDGFSMEKIDALRALFMDTVYVFNLADLSFMLERFYEFSNQAFWQLVEKHLDAYAASGVTDQERLQRIGDRQAEIMVESLLKKKIMDGGVLDYYEHPVNNQLFNKLQTQR